MNRAKMQQAQDAQRAFFATQTIPINDHWRIIRFDASNWQIQFRKSTPDKWNEKGYYGRLSHAFEALLDKHLAESINTSLPDVVQSCRDFTKAVTDAIAAVHCRIN